MEYRPLSACGMQVSVLGLGAVQLGRAAGLKYAKPSRRPGPEEARQLIGAARSLGINLIDTAPAYGNSEERLGELLAADRERWIIVTKVGEEFDGARSTHDFRPERAEMSVQRSLRRLRTDCLDVVLIHSDGNDERIIRELGTLDCLKELKRRGLIRAFGLSHKTASGARAALDAGAEVLMATLNPQDRSQAQVIREAGERGCGVLIKKPLAGGRALPEALRFAADHPGVASVVVGTANPAHLAENAAILDPQSPASH